MEMVRCSELSPDIDAAALTLAAMQGPGSFESEEMDAAQDTNISESLNIFDGDAVAMYSAQQPHSLELSPNTDDAALTLAAMQRPDSFESEERNAALDTKADESLNTLDVDAMAMCSAQQPCSLESLDVLPSQDAHSESDDYGGDESGVCISVQSDSTSQVKKMSTL